MAHIGLISCVRQKQEASARAMDMYGSTLFKKSRAYVEQRCDLWFIMSAKYGLVAPDRVIERYEMTLNTMPLLKRLEWSQRVWLDLRSHLSPGDKVTILAGERYRKHLILLLENYGCQVHVPLQGMAIGKQLQWLSQQI